MAFEDMSLDDQNEMRALRRMLYRAVMELAYIHEFDGTEFSNLITSAEGKSIVDEGMKLLGVADLSEEQLPVRLEMA